MLRKMQPWRQSIFYKKARAQYLYSYKHYAGILNSITKRKYMVDLSNVFKYRNLTLKQFSDYNLHPWLRDGLNQKFSYASNIQKQVRICQWNYLTLFDVGTRKWGTEDYIEFFILK